MYRSRPLCCLRKRQNHLVVGEITLDSDTFTYDADPDPQVIVYTAEPGSPSEQALRILASSAANEHEPARSLTD